MNLIDIIKRCANNNICVFEIDGILYNCKKSGYKSYNCSYIEADIPTWDKSKNIILYRREFNQIYKVNYYATLCAKESYECYTHYITFGKRVRLTFVSNIENMMNRYDTISDILK